MSKRIRRKSISNTFKIKGHLCKVILDPWCRLENGFYNWNVGFAIGKSNRQINDWYHKRKNKRARSLNKKLTGDVGVKAIAEGWKTVLKLRWNVAPGDSLTISCTSGKPEHQFRAFKYWQRHHCDWLCDDEKLEFRMNVCPSLSKVIWNKAEIIGVTPKNPLEPIHPGAYFDCFTFVPKE